MAPLGVLDLSLVLMFCIFFYFFFHISPGLIILHYPKLSGCNVPFKLSIWAINPEFGRIIAIWSLRSKSVPKIRKWLKHSVTQMVMWLFFSHPRGLSLSLPFLSWPLHHPHLQTATHYQLHNSKITSITKFNCTKVAEFTFHYLLGISNLFVFVLISTVRGTLQDFFQIRESIAQIKILVRTLQQGW